MATLSPRPVLNLARIDLVRGRVRIKMVVRFIVAVMGLSHINDMDSS